jgi:hypothetical protein
VQGDADADTPAAAERHRRGAVATCFSPVKTFPGRCDPDRRTTYDGGVNCEAGGTCGRPIAKGDGNSARSRGPSSTVRQTALRSYLSQPAVEDCARHLFPSIGFAA